MHGKVDSAAFGEDRTIALGTLGRRRTRDTRSHTEHRRRSPRTTPRSDIRSSRSSPIPKGQRSAYVSVAARKHYPPSADLVLTIGFEYGFQRAQFSDGTYMYATRLPHVGVGFAWIL